MKVWIDQVLCMGAGTCELLAPDLFEATEMGSGWSRRRRYIGATAWCSMVARDQVMGRAALTGRPGCLSLSWMPRWKQPRSARGSASTSTCEVPSQMAHRPTLRLHNLGST